MAGIDPVKPNGYCSEFIHSTMTYLGVNTRLFEGVPSLGAILSAAEMLQQKCPLISGALVKYAVALIENNLAQVGSTQELDAALAPLAQRAGASHAAGARDLERFGDALVAAAVDDYAVDFYKLGYLCYTATSIYGPLTTRLQQKLSKAENLLNSGTPAFTADLGAIPSPPTGFPSYPSIPGSGGPPVFTPGGSGGPPVFTPGGAGGPPVFTPGGAGGPPVFTPGGSGGAPAGGPPVFTPGGAGGAGGPPVFTPGGAGGPPVFTPGTEAPREEGDAESTARALELSTLANEAFQAGNDQIAVSAILAALKELKH